jgi:sugar phosphate isomerase/epimerase
MKLGALGIIWSDWRDVTTDTVRFAADLGLQGIGAHLTVPAAGVAPQTAARVAGLVADHGLELLQIWGPYPSIISPDERVRREGVEGARAIVRLAAQMGVAGAGVRPTSHNPRGDWWPHPDNYSQETEDRFVRSLGEVVETAAGEGINVILETHVTTVLHSPERIRRVIGRVGSPRLRLNLDPVNFVGDLAAAYSPAPLVHRLFSELGPYTDTVHIKDYVLEDRFVVHISETTPGAGMMDLDTVLRCTHNLAPGMYGIIEHLPLDQLAIARRNLGDRLTALGIPVG